MRPNTHPRISPHLVGEPLVLSDGKASARLLTRPEMAADHEGLVHGGFTFGLADYAAMLAVNDPNVVLGGASSRFLAPVRVGEELVASAEVLAASGKKREVSCRVLAGEKVVFEGTFTCFVLEKHILDQK